MNFVRPDTELLAIHMYKIERGMLTRGQVLGRHRYNLSYEDPRASTPRGLISLLMCCQRSPRADIYETCRSTLFAFQPSFFTSDHERLLQALLCPPFPSIPSLASSSSDAQPMGRADTRNPLAQLSSLTSLSPVVSFLSCYHLFFRWEPAGSGSQ